MKFPCVPYWRAALLANWITLSRIPLLLINVLILYFGSPELKLAGVALLFLGLMLDTVDGVVARRRGQTSLFGSVIDIAADRAYELILWVCFAHLGLVPIAIPLIVLARTTLTDAFRSIEVAQGTAPFAQHRTALARFMVGSTWMRVGYSASKVATFCGLAFAHACRGYPAESGLGRAVDPLTAVVGVLAWIAVVFCVLRGLPVIIHSLRRHWRRGPVPGSVVQ
jgi:CDP-diacylglycerol--glycerol-3-phosphate 3-phosphatidyltransferase